MYRTCSTAEELDGEEERRSGEAEDVAEEQEQEQEECESVRTCCT